MTTSDKKWMIYGANGYTGQLITEAAIANGQSPILAGRNPQAMLLTCKKYSLPTRIFDLSNETPPEVIQENLKDIEVVVHCAGPFSATAKPMLLACMETKTNYIDITGEARVFEEVMSLDTKIKAAGITAIPGMGFDVVPSDCLAAKLKEKLPNATELSLAFKPHLSKISDGTAKTMLESSKEGTLVRRNGQIKTLKGRAKSKRIPLSPKPVKGINISWGDVATAYHSTGIPNVDVYLITRKRIALMIKFSHLFRWFLHIPFIIPLLHRYLAKNNKTPSPSERLSDKTIVWGEAKNPNGTSAEMSIQTPNGYTLTTRTVMKAVGILLTNPPKPGYHTPSKAFGSNFIDDIEGIKLLN